MGYFFDGFRIPVPYAPHIAIDIDEVLPVKGDMLACHEPQIFEWLPYNGIFAGPLPADPAARRTWCHDRLAEYSRRVANTARETLAKLYGPTRGKAIRTAETVSISEYGRALPESEYHTLFPFLPECASDTRG